MERLKKDFVVYNRLKDQVLEKEKTKNRPDVVPTSVTGTASVDTSKAGNQQTENNITKENEKGEEEEPQVADSDQSLMVGDDGQAGDQNSEQGNKNEEGAESKL